MKPLDLQSEVFSATGGTTADGVANQLGRPKASRLELLVREAVQNSWDARTADRGVVRFEIHGHVLTGNQREALREILFAQDAPGTGLATALKDAPQLSVLAICDAGTTGLGGPTRADQLPAPDEQANFVNFMRYVGRTQTRAFSGGTYGFGKSAYFLASSLRTIGVYTRCIADGSEEARFMATALGSQYTDSESKRQLTGRHWWGRRGADDIVDPIVGAEADAALALIGASPDAAKRLGTCVFVLQPDFGDQQPQAALKDISYSILHQFWPKMVDGPGGIGTMSFDVRWEGTGIPIPDVRTTAPYHGFAHAFSILSNEVRPPPAGFSEPIENTLFCHRPKQQLGRALAVRFPVIARTWSEAQSGDDDVRKPYAALYEKSHHIALMRAPNFVVKYVSGPATPHDQFEYAGVFKADAEIDEAFAVAEPPTHDDWTPDLLEGSNEKTYVRVTHKRVKEFVDAFAAPPLVAAVEPHATRSVGGFSEQLGGLVPSLSEAGPPIDRGGGRPASGGAGGGRSSPHARPRVRIEGEPRTEIFEGASAVVIEFQLENLGSDGAVVLADTTVVVDGAAEVELPAGSQSPRVLQWLGPNGRVVNGPTCDVGADGSSGPWAVFVSVPPDALVGVSLRLEPSR